MKKINKTLAIAAFAVISFFSVQTASARVYIPNPNNDPDIDVAFNFIKNFNYMRMDPKADMAFEVAYKTLLQDILEQNIYINMETAEWLGEHGWIIRWNTELVLGCLGKHVKRF